MKAGRIHFFGLPNAIVIDEIPYPTPEEGELMRITAAGVGSWGALIREGKNVAQLSLPIVLGLSRRFRYASPDARNGNNRGH